MTKAAVTEVTAHISDVDEYLSNLMHSSDELGWESLTVTARPAPITRADSGSKFIKPAVTAVTAAAVVVTDGSGLVPGAPAQLLHKQGLTPPNQRVNYVAEPNSVATMELLRRSSAAKRLPHGHSKVGRGAA